MPDGVTVIVRAGPGTRVRPRVTATLEARPPKRAVIDWDLGQMTTTRARGAFRDTSHCRAPRPARLGPRVLAVPRDGVLGHGRAMGVWLLHSKGPATT
jgi:hypothetical protein